jgi:hypothetical protein
VQVKKRALMVLMVLTISMFQSILELPRDDRCNWLDYHSKKYEIALRGVWVGYAFNQEVSQREAETDRRLLQVVGSKASV